MVITIIRRDNIVIVDGEPRSVSCAALPEGVHAIQWHGTYGEVEFEPHLVDGVMHKVHNKTITDLGVFQQFAEAWNAARPESEVPGNGVQAVLPLDSGGMRVPEVREDHWTRAPVWKTD